MKSLIEFFKMIKLEHSLFALPFAFTGMIIGAKGIPEINIILWVIVAMVGARSAAMGLNRLIDANIDGKNPRTENRSIPKGLISKKQTFLYIILSLIIYFIATYMINSLAFMLSPIPVLVFILYSYTKRFTNMCHIVLGVALGLAPIGAWVAATGELPLPAFILGIGVLFWVAGFDILYAIQDIDFDRSQGLYSIPALMGISGALITARVLHIIAFILFFILKFMVGLGTIYLAGILISGAFLAYEHSLVSKNDLSKLNVAFFNINAYISIIIFVFTLIDLLVKQ